MEDKLLKELNNKYMILRNYCLNKLEDKNMIDLINLFDKAYNESLRQINNINVRIMLDKEDCIGGKSLYYNNYDKKTVTFGSILFILGISNYLANDVCLFIIFTFLVSLANRKVLKGMDENINLDNDVIIYKRNLDTNLRLKNSYIKLIEFLIKELNNIKFRIDDNSLYIYDKDSTKKYIKSHI